MHYLCIAKKTVSLMIYNVYSFIFYVYSLIFISLKIYDLRCSDLHYE